MPDRTETVTVDVGQALTAEIRETEAMLALAERQYADMQRRRLARGEPGPLLHVVARAPGEAKVVHRLGEPDREMLIDLGDGELLEAIASDRQHLRALRALAAEIDGAPTPAVPEDSDMPRHPQYITVPIHETPPEPAQAPEPAASEGPPVPLILAARRAVEAAETEEMRLSQAHMPRRREIAQELAVIVRQIDAIQGALSRHASPAELLAASQTLQALAERRQALITEGQAMAEARVQAGERAQAARTGLSRLQAEYAALAIDLAPGQRHRWAGEVLVGKIRRLAELIGDGWPTQPGIDVDHYLEGLAAQERAAVARRNLRQA